jgi:hypothetical protein
MIRMRTVVFIAAFLAVMLLAPDCAFARAGGGGGGGGGFYLGRHRHDMDGLINVLVTFLMLPAMALNSFLPYFLIEPKRQEAAKLLHRLEELDPLWCEARIYARIEAAYFAVQNAWTERNQDLAREFMSDRLYKKHKAQTDAMLNKHRRNVLENVNFIHAKVIGVRQFSLKDKDHFYVQIKGSMIDYQINTDAGTIVSGDSESSEEFTEIWQFIRGDADWLLHEIVQKPQLITVLRCVCTSDSLGTDASSSEMS